MSMLMRVLGSVGRIAIGVVVVGTMFGAFAMLAVTLEEWYPSAWWDEVRFIIIVASVPYLTRFAARRGWLTGVKTAKQ